MGNGVAIDTAAMGRFLAYLQSTGRRGAGFGMYRLDDDFILPQPVLLDMTGSVVLQTMPERGFLQLRGPG